MKDLSLAQMESLGINKWMSDKEVIVKSKNKLKYEGATYTTNNYGKLIILEYVDYSNVIVEFIKTGYKTSARMDHILAGQVKDKLTPNLFGAGVLGENNSELKGEALKTYRLWQGMIARCYDTKFKSKRLTYIDCTSSENFKYFQFFKEWCNSQVGFNSLDDKGLNFELDKDILIKGNKLYSENTCVFVPKEINSLFIKSVATRGELPLGVVLNKSTGKYHATIHISSRNKHLGSFNTIEQAFYAYKQAKELRIKEAANKWKDQIDPRAYQALMNYQVEITD